MTTKRIDKLISRHYFDLFQPSEDAGLAKLAVKNCSWSTGLLLIPIISWNVTWQLFGTHEDVCIQLLELHRGFIQLLVKLLF